MEAKNTLLNVIAGILRADHGTIVTDNKVVFEKKNGTSHVDVPPERRGVGFVPQDYALFPHVGVKDNIEIGLRTMNLSKAEVKRRV